MSLYVSFFLMLINLEECKSILLKGKRAQDGQFPWLIQFQTVIPCGGVLLSPDWVLTAAQCVQDKRNSIILFASGLNGSDSRQTVPVKATYIYPMYRAYSAYPDRDYNIALMKLTKPFDTCQEDIILPNILPVKYEDNYKLCLIFGWQSYISLSSKVLAKPIQYYEVILNSWKICTYMIKANANYTNIFCAMVEFIDEMKACAGNPGSPLVCENENNETALIGIASWTNFSLDCGDLPTYLDLAAFRMWIDGLVFHNRDKGELEYNNNCNNRGHISNISTHNSLWNCSDLLQADSKTENKKMKLHNTSQGTKHNKKSTPCMRSSHFCNKFHLATFCRSNNANASSLDGYQEMSFTNVTTELTNIYKYEEIGSFQNNSQTVKNLNKHSTVSESVLCNNQNLDEVSIKHDRGHIEIEDFDILLPFNFEDVTISYSNVTSIHIRRLHVLFYFVSWYLYIIIYM